MIGTIVGNYKILHALGEGGAGMVYKGVDTMLDREVAVKVLRPELASQTAVVERFRSEAVTLAKLSHPNIATLFSLFRHANDLIMVMEFVRGESLETIIQKRGRIPAADAIPIFCQALDGINHAHEVGIIHRDIKPSNMILTETGTLKVLDFGIARLLGSSRMTRVGNIIGTLEYMSPEQVRGEDTDARSDIYALGMMLYEILTGKLPFESDNEFVLMKMQTEQMPVPPRQLNPDIPPELEAAIMCAVAKNPSERFQNAGEFLQKLLAVDLPMSSVQQFGLVSLYQAKLRTRPSNPGLRATESLPENLPPNAPNNQATEILQNISFTGSAGISPTDQPTAILENIAPPENETKKIVPPNAENNTLLFDANKNETVNPPKETRIGSVKNLPPSKPVIKETRLGASENRQSIQSGVKATRLGAAEEHNSAGENPKTFFEKLRWIHYAGAAAFVLFSAIGLAAVGTIVFSSRSVKNSTNRTVVKDEPKKPEITAEKVADNSNSAAVYAPPITSNDTPNYGAPLTPLETKNESSGKNADVSKDTKDTKAQTPTDAKKSATKDKTPSETTAAKTVSPPKQNPPSPRPNPPTAPVTRSTPDLTDN